MINYEMIPEQFRDAMRRYVERGIPTGSFLLAVLSNNFHDAVVYRHNLNHLLSFANFIYNELPSEAWGSKEKVDAWIKSHSTKELETVK